MATYVNNVDKPSKPTSIKVLAESYDLKSIPPNYVHSTEPTFPDSSEDSIPIIDFSYLTSVDPDQRSKAILDLAKACQDWGFFMVVNHGVPATLLNAVMDKCNEFFDMSEIEKSEFEGKDMLDPIRYGTSFNVSKEKTLFWRDFLKVIVHPEFQFPNNPKGFSEIAAEYCETTRRVARELLRAISVTLGLEERYIEKDLDLDSGFQVFVANLYPPCPQPELAMGLPPHSDHGLLTLLIQNGVGGLQVQHDGKWIGVDALPDSFLVNTGDHLEILSNGRYKSVLHRAVVNDRTTRISLAMGHGPSLETVVKPASELINGESNVRSSEYRPMKYKEYIQMQQSNQLNAKSALDRIRSIQNK